MLFYDWLPFAVTCKAHAFEGLPFRQEAGGWGGQDARRGPWLSRPCPELQLLLFFPGEMEAGQAEVSGMFLKGGGGRT